MHMLVMNLTDFQLIQNDAFVANEKVADIKSLIDEVIQN